MNWIGGFVLGISVGALVVIVLGVAYIMVMISGEAGDDW